MKVIIHIGTEKTGTTSIQQSLAVDRHLLAERGILYPRLFGSENHMEVAVAAMEPRDDDELQMIELKRQSCSHTDYVRKLRLKILHEVQLGDYSTLLISNEHCHSRLTLHENICTLRSLFESFATSFEIVVYLRRQDRLALSIHSTRLKLGGLEDVFPKIDEGYLSLYFDFYALLKRFSLGFGSTNIKARIYEKSLLLNQNVVDDFYSTASLGISPSSRPKLNEALSSKQAKFLESFNKKFPLVADGVINSARGDIFSVIANVGLGDPFLPSRGDAEKFYNLFEGGNVKVRDKFFPQLSRESLFDESFEEYPHCQSNADLTFEDTMLFVAAIWTYYGGEVRS